MNEYKQLALDRTKEDVKYAISAILLAFGIFAVIMVPMILIALWGWTICIIAPVYASFFIYLRYRSHLRSSYNIYNNRADYDELG